MNKSILISIVLFLFLAFACRDTNQPETVVTGQVFDPVLNRGWAGVSIIALDLANLDVLEQAFTDAEGYYEIRYRARTENSVNVGVSLDEIAVSAGYPVTTCANPPLESAINGQIQEFNFDVFSMAFLRLSLLNDNCQGSQDQMDLTWANSWTVCESSSFQVSLEGCTNFNENKDSTILFPAGIQVFEWTVSRNGIDETFVDSILMNAGEELDFDLNY